MSKLDLKQFEQTVAVRPLRPADYEQVKALQAACFPGMEPWTRDQFGSQLAVFPEGQIGVECRGRLVASSSSLILDFELYKDWHNYDEITDNGYIRNHKPDGKTLYGIEIMVDPKYRGLKLARRLYDARKRLAREKNLMRIVVGGRIPGYAAHAGSMSAREYIDKVLSKDLFDPILTTQLSNGFVIKRLIPGYLGADADSRGYAAFLEWANLDYVPDVRQRFVPVAPVRVCAVQYQMRTVTDFAAFAGQCEFFVDVASEYKCDFILFPEIFTTQILSFVKAGSPAEAVRTPLGIHASLPGTLHAPGGQVQRERHRRLALHRGRRPPLQHRLPVPSRRDAGQAVQAARHADGAPLVGGAGRRPDGGVRHRPGEGGDPDLL